MMKLHSVTAPMSDAKFIGDEPTWHDVVVDEKNYNLQLGRGLNWHNYCASEKDCQKYLEVWMREHRPRSYKTDVEAFRKLSYLNKTICMLARMQLQGFPLNVRDEQHIRNYIMEFTGVMQKVTETEEVVTPKVKTGPSIQDRIRNQVSQILSDLDVKVDEAFDGTETDAQEVAGHILSQNFKGPQLKLVQQYLEKNIVEWQSAYNKEDEQLVEGYSYVSRRNFKKIIDSFQEIMEKISQEQSKVKSLRVRKKKPQDKKKIASKIRFQSEHEGIKSVAPVNIIGANMLWVYDTKKRRLGYYEAETKDSLYVKGTKIEGFKVSCEKILRKPEEQLPHLLSLRKNQTANWFDTIRAKCKVMTGRTTTNLLIVRVD